MSSRQKIGLQSSPSETIRLAEAVFSHFEKDRGCRFDLKYPAGAPKVVETDTCKLKFRFFFPDGSIVEGKPWVLLSDDEALPWNALAAAFVYETTRHLWSTMNDNFNTLVASGTVSLFARRGNISEPFSSIPNDTWSTYRVVDWENGTAMGVSGAELFSIRAAEKKDRPNRTPAGRKPYYDQDQINALVLAQIEKRGFPKIGGEPEWLSHADVQRLIAHFCVRTTGQEPAVSTLQKLAKNALAACRQKPNADNA